MTEVVATEAEIISATTQDSAYYREYFAKEENKAKHKKTMAEYYERNKEKNKKKLEEKMKLKREKFKKLYDDGAITKEEYEAINYRKMAREAK